MIQKEIIEKTNNNFQNIFPVNQYFYIFKDIFFVFSFYQKDTVNKGL